MAVLKCDERLLVGLTPSSKAPSIPPLSSTSSSSATSSAASSAYAANGMVQIKARQSTCFVVELNIVDGLFVEGGTCPMGPKGQRSTSMVKIVSYTSSASH